MQGSNSSKSLGKEGQARNAAMARYLQKMTGQVAQSQDTADLKSREVLGRQLQRRVLRDKGAP